MPKTMPLWGEVIPAFDPEKETPNEMWLYPIDTDVPAPAVVIFPGGAYAFRSEDWEGEDIAAFYNRHGFHAFVVRYRVTPNYHPAPLADAQRGIRLVRAHAAEWGVDPNRIFVCGFSAGGHLAASAAVLTEDVSAVGDALDEVDFRPNGAILGYAVISGMEQHGHTGSHHNLLGDAYDEMHTALSLQTRVDETTPPCFIWHTAADTCVPVCHSLLLADALAKNGIPYELHNFPFGRHGMGLAHEVPEVSRWAEWSVDWIRRQ